VAAAASNDVWAVGGVFYDAQNCGNGDARPAFIEHWDGTAWSIVPTPIRYTSMLAGVAVVASNDAWAVGYNEPGGGGNLTTLTEHWDGFQWKVVPSPNLQSQWTYFKAVTAVATNDVWAVGAYLKSPTNVTAPFAEHWDGTEWKIVAVPDTESYYSYLFGASSVGGNEVWATGYTDLALRWDGTSWVSVPAPSVGGSLNGVFMFPNGQGWAVGYQNPSCCVALTVTEYWDEKAWTIVPSPNPSSSLNILSGVSATSANDVWAVGSYDSANTLMEHWDGKTWSIVPSP
jgi:hypothetical protein